MEIAHAMQAEPLAMKIGYAFQFVLFCANGANVRFGFFVCGPHLSLVLCVCFGGLLRGPITCFGGLLCLFWTYHVLWRFFFVCPSILCAGRVEGFPFVAPPQKASGYRANSSFFVGGPVLTGRTRNSGFFLDQTVQSR